DLAIADLLAALAHAKKPAVDPDWLPGLRRTEAQYRSKLDRMARANQVPMHPGALGQAIAAALPRDAIVVYDGGHTTFWSNDLTPAYDVRTRFPDPGTRPLGFGLPYALSLQLQHPQRPVVNITGDGAFGFTLQELDTARRYGLPVV